MTLAGQWYNEYGSKLNVVVGAVSPQGVPVTGTFELQPGDIFPIAGMLEPLEQVAFGLATPFVPQPGTTSWTGIYQPSNETLQTTWVYADGPSGQISSGNETWTRTPQAKSAAQSASAKRPAYYDAGRAPKAAAPR